MFSHERIYTVHEKLEASDPADRVVLVREGFAFWALVFNLLWLLANRLWLAAAGYMAVSVAVAVFSLLLGLSEAASTMLQVLLQALLAYHAYDLMRWSLARRGYRFVGVITAENEMYAQRRYDEFARA